MADQEKGRYLIDRTKEEIEDVVEALGNISRQPEFGVAGAAVDSGDSLILAGEKLGSMLKVTFTVQEFVENMRRAYQLGKIDSVVHLFSLLSDDGRSLDELFGFISPEFAIESEPGKTPESEGGR